MKNTEAEKNLSIKDLKEFEIRYNVILPNDFKEYYLSNNGGYPPYNYIDSKEYVLSIDGFLSIKYGNLTIETLIEDYKKEGVIFTTSIPFANDSSGNIFFIVLNEKDYGIIKLWRIENSYNEKELLFVSQSFTDFLDSMVEDYEEDGEYDEE